MMENSCKCPSCGKISNQHHISKKKIFYFKVKNCQAMVTWPTYSWITSSHVSFLWTRFSDGVSWLIRFYPQRPRRGILASNKAHLSPPTHTFKQWGRPACSQTGELNPGTWTEGKKPNRCPTNCYKLSFLWITMLYLLHVIWQMVRN